MHCPSAKRNGPSRGQAEAGRGPIRVRAERQQRHRHAIFGICQLFLSASRFLSRTTGRAARWFEVEYRGKQYTIVQGVEPGTWKWTVRLDEKTARSGTDKTRAAAMSTVERLIDRALAPKKVKPPR